MTFYRGFSLTSASSIYDLRILAERDTRAETGDQACP